MIANVCGNVMLMLVMRKRMMILTTALALLASEVLAETPWRIVDNVPRTLDRQPPFPDVDIDFPERSIDIVPMRTPKDYVTIEIPGSAQDVNISDRGARLEPPSLDLIEDIAKGAFCRIIRVPGGYWYEFDQDFKFQRMAAINFVTHSLPVEASGTPEEIRRARFKHHYLSCIR